MTNNIRDELRKAASTSASLDQLVAKAAESCLFSKVAALEACKANPYQPSLVWCPSIFGSMMQLDLRETVAKQIFLTGAFEPDLLWLMTCIVDTGQNVIDGGAHIGFFSLALGLLVGPGGRVDAFEPVPSTKQHLDTNIRNADLKNVFTHNMALWQENTILKINDFGHQFSAYNGAKTPRLSSADLPNCHELSVPATSIDAFVAATNITPNFIKLDVESAEYEVIKGMANTVASNRPVIVLEIGDFEGCNSYSSYQIMQLLVDSSYEIFNLKNCRLSPLRLEGNHYDYANVVALPQESASELLKKTCSLGAC